MKSVRPPATAAVCLAAALLCAWPAASLAQAPVVAASSRDGHAAAAVLNAARATSAIRVDGRLDEEAWDAAQPVTTFTQFDPSEGEPASQPTEVRVAYDHEALYVAARMRDTHRVSSRLSRRDTYFTDSDWFGIALDSYHDHLSAYAFQVNPSGVVVDFVMKEDGDDTSWDAVWDVATEVSDSGWVAELRIPFSQLRFSEADLQHWGIQLWRKIGRTQETSFFSFSPKAEAGGVARFGHLAGLRGLRPGRRLELLPYASARAEYTRPDAGSPFRDGSDGFGGAGLDLKYRLSSNVTLDATVNPDFGQVEVDPAEVNLTAFETFFEERRPFFVEGADVFGFSGAGGQLFYSRRIGAPPHGGAPGEALFSRMPEATTIAGAAKVTGRLPGGWTLGVVDVVTPRENVAWTGEDGVLHRSAVEPATNYFAGRLKRDLRGGNSSVGALFTAVNRQLGGDDDLAGLLRGSAYAGGVDFRHAWARRSWSLTGAVAYSAISGRPGVITSAQRSSARYFQRPDAGHLSLDPLATGLSGYAASVALSKVAGAHWRGSASLAATSPGYEINDLGYQSAADRVEGGTSVSYVQNRPNSVFRRWNAGGGLTASWNYGGDRLGTRASASWYGQLPSYWSIGMGMDQGLAGLDDRLTRGGPLARGLARGSAYLNVNTDPRKRITGSLSATRGWDEAGGERSTLSLRMGLRPAPSWNLSFGPRLTRSSAAAQYVGSTADSLATGTFGRRYVFAPLSQTSVGFDTRLGVTFSPTLTLELYAQPFLAAGDYGDFREFTEPRGYRFRDFGQEGSTVSRGESCAAPERAGTRYLLDPDGTGPAACIAVSERDFTLASLQGNAVLRWEWRPGSTLFMVWQQQRSVSDPLGNLDFGRDTGALFGARPDNVFMIKVNYWLNP